MGKVRREARRRSAIDQKMLTVNPVCVVNGPTLTTTGNVPAVKYPAGTWALIWNIPG